jgi:hypothetical protein
MKKSVKLFIPFLLMAGLLAGCKASPTPAPSPSSSSSASPSSSASASPSSSSQSSASPGQTKMGMAVITSISKSTDAGTSDGTAETDATVVALLVDKEGKILACKIDAVQAKITFDKKGTLLLPAATQFQSKDELGEKYGLKKASGIGKEWNEQATAFAKYVEGKTIDAVKGIKVDERNYPTAPDLKASVTISIGDFMKGVEKAASEAKESGASQSDNLSVGIVTTMAKSTSAAEGKAGLAQADITCVALTRGSSGAVTGCLIDGVQSKISFSQEGKITTDLTQNPKTKNELKEEYGLKKASGIKKEWNEQAEAFAKYVVGKTPAEIGSIAIDTNGYPIASDIKSSVTISIGDFKSAILKASSGA